MRDLMRMPHSALFLSTLFLAILPSRVQPQIINDGAMTTLANVTNIITGDVTVGTNGSFTLLVLSNNCLLTNSATGFIGREDTTSSNEVRLVSATARWSMGRDLFVGTLGSFNRLAVSSGAVVQNSFGFIGTETGSNNAALVTGPGSTWHNQADLHVGRTSTSSRLEIISGGRVINSNGVVGTESSGNVAIVSGSGSVWSNATSLTIGDTGSGNLLQVGGGGLVVAASGTLGQNTTASANTAEITDTGSELRFSNNFKVGSDGSFNRLRVSGGAQLSDYSGIIGGTVMGSNNAAIVSGPGSLWMNSSDFTVGLFGERNVLLVSNGGMVASPFGGVGDGAAHNLVVVTGFGSVWSNDFFSVGFHGHSNRVRIENGGLLISGRASIGQTGRSNEVSLTGAGSVWNIRSDLTVGVTGQRNRLVVSDGATALTGGDVRIGENDGGSSNAVVAGGPGARWLVTSNLFIGNSGSFNCLVVNNGGFVGNLATYVGFDLTASNNLAMVAGPGSILTNDTMIIGFEGNGNELVVTNGGSVHSYLIGIGDGHSSDNNLAVVTGPGSVWESTFLTVGVNGDRNRLVVSDAGRVSSESSRLVSSRNEVIVTGAGSLWSNRLGLDVGGYRSANLLAVNNGGTVLSSNIIVGSLDSSTNNRVIVAGGTLRATAADGSGFLDVRRGTNVLNSGLVDVDRLVLTNRGTIPAPVLFADSASISIPVVGPATPYPSILTVAGLVGAITRVTVTLSNLSHTFPLDLKIMLVSPAGQKVMLMSQAGGGADIVGATLTFDDHAIMTLPTANIVPGIYRPTDYSPGGTMPAPAPGPPYSTNLSSFNGSNPNGAWSLYIHDGIGGDEGTLEGWSVQFATDVRAFLDSSTFDLNGGTLVTRGVIIDNNRPFVLGGPGGVPAVWEARAGVGENVVARDLLVGNNSSFNQLTIPSVVSAGANVIVGASPSVSTNNLLHVAGGTLRVLTAGAVLDVRGGTNRLDAGLVDVFHLVVTNTRGQFEFNGGTLRTPNTAIANGRIFTVGGGANTATLQLLGGTHTFANNLTVATNGSLIGTGTLDGTVTVSPGGRLTPGAPIGNIYVLGSVILQGTVNLQIDKSGGVRASDRMISSGAIFYGGTLNVIDIGTDVLVAGDRFVLFDATPYVGAFTILNLPPLAPGLSWANHLSVDGSIEVVSASQPKFSNIFRSGTNLIFSGTNGAAGQNYAVLTATNVTTVAANWQSLVTNEFGAGGQFSFTNGINRNEPQRYFRLRSP